MSPTCSKRLLAGRNALSTAVLTITPPDEASICLRSIPVKARICHRNPLRHPQLTGESSTHNRGQKVREMWLELMGLRGMLRAPCGRPVDKPGMPAEHALG